MTAGNHWPALGIDLERDATSPQMGNLPSPASPASQPADLGPAQEGFIGGGHGASP